MKPTEVNSEQLHALSLMIQEKLAKIPSQPRSLLGDLETCIGAAYITPNDVSVAELSLSSDMIVMIARWLGNEERVEALVSSSMTSDGFFSEQLSDQLLREGMTLSYSVFSFSIVHYEISAVELVILLL